MALFCVISANPGSFRVHCVKVHVRYLVSWWVLVVYVIDSSVLNLMLLNGASVKYVTCLVLAWKCWVGCDGRFVSGTWWRARQRLRWVTEQHWREGWTTLRGVGVTACQSHQQPSQVTSCSLLSTLQLNITCWDDRLRCVLLTVHVTGSDVRCLKMCNDFLVAKVNCWSYVFNIMKYMWILRNIEK